MRKAVPKWDEHHREIERLLKEKGYKGFLKFEPIRRAVWVGNAKHIRYKLQWIVDHSRSTTLSLFAMRELLEEPWIGNPDPLPIAPYTSGTRVNMLYHLMQVKQKCRVYFRNFDFIFEFGGGYGCLADMIYKLGFRGSYWFYDVPVMLKLVDYYMKSALAKADIFGDIPAYRLISNEEEFSMPEITNSAFIGTMSFTETPLEVRPKFDQHFSKFKLLFFAYAEKFFGIDNVKYFEEIKERLPNYDWEDWLVDGDLPVVRPGKRYICGIRKDY